MQNNNKTGNYIIDRVSKSINFLKYQIIWPFYAKARLVSVIKLPKSNIQYHLHTIKLHEIFLLRQFRAILSSMNLKSTWLIETLLTWCAVERLLYCMQPLMSGFLTVWNTFHNMSTLKGLSPVWILWCCSKSLVPEKAFPHSKQTWECSLCFLRLFSQR